MVIVFLVGLACSAAAGSGFCAGVVFQALGGPKSLLEWAGSYSDGPGKGLPGPGVLRTFLGSLGGRRGAPPWTLRVPTLTPREALVAEHTAVRALLRVPTVCEVCGTRRSCAGCVSARRNSRRGVA